MTDLSAPDEDLLDESEDPESMPEAEPEEEQDTTSPLDSFGVGFRVMLAVAQLGLVGVIGMVVYQFTDSVVLAVVGGVVLGVIVAALVALLLILFAAKKFDDALPFDLF